MSEAGKLGFRLFIITAVAALALSIVNGLTQPLIEKQRENAETSARAIVLQGATSFEQIEVKPEYADTQKVQINEIYAGYGDGEKLLGYTFKAISKGFGGDIELIVGVSEQGKLGGVKVTNHTETAGLGAKIDDKNFTNQYTDIPIENPVEVTKSSPAAENQIEAITGATVTSSSVTEAVNQSINYYKNVLMDGGANE